MNIYANTLGQSVPIGEHSISCSSYYGWARSKQIQKVYLCVSMLVRMHACLYSHAHSVNGHFVTISRHICM